MFLLTKINERISDFVAIENLATQFIEYISKRKILIRTTN